MDWNTHQEYIHRLLFAMSAPAPPGFSQVSINQVVRADRELFTIMAREHPPPFKARPDGSKPLNDALKSLMIDTRVQVWLLPSPSGLANKPSVPGSAEQGSEGNDTAPPPPKEAPPPKEGQEGHPGCPKVLQESSQRGLAAGVLTWMAVRWKLWLLKACPGARKVSTCACFCHKPGHSFSNCRSKSAPPKA